MLAIGCHKLHIHLSFLPRQRATLIIPTLLHANFGHHSQCIPEDIVSREMLPIFGFLVPKLLGSVLLPSPLWFTSLDDQGTEH